MAAPQLKVRQLFSLLKQSAARARAALGADQLLVPLEPWAEPDDSLDIDIDDIDAPAVTGRGHPVAVGAAPPLPAFDAWCYPLLQTAPVTVGRASSAGVSIDQATISRIHAELFCIDGVFSVLDKGSYNGTLVNDRVLEKGQVVELKNGDVVIFGEARLLFADLAHLAKLI